MIVVISMIKDAFEDYRRYSRDEQENSTDCIHYNYSTSKFQHGVWRDLRVGDIVQVNNDQPMPADLIILTTSENKGSCYVETKNLDGETNLKLKTANRDVFNLISEPKDMSQLMGGIECEGPNNNIHKFEGVINISKEGSASKKISLSADNLTLRGSYLRNTEHMYGMVVFTGHDTKIMQNSAKAVYKMSELEKNTNLCILVILSLQLILSITASAIGCTLEMTVLNNVNILEGRGLM